MDPVPASPSRLSVSSIMVKEGRDSIKSLGETQDVEPQVSSIGDASQPGEFDNPTPLISTASEKVNHTEYYTKEISESNIRSRLFLFRKSALEKMFL